ncbi:MAG: TetR/AcrR family transcriptional regulator [Aquisalinus sp.]|nr:TetR/AcrR family transcriptional regulator [Aquisalinus sp.]
MSGYHHGNLREAILERAAEVVETGGVEAVSLRALARDLGVSSTAPAKHFQSRHDLLRTLAKEGYKGATRAVLSKVNGEDFIHPNTMAKAFVGWAVDNPSLFSTIMHPDITRHADDELKAALADFAAAVRHSLAKAQELGWQEDRSIDELFHSAIAFVRGLALNVSDPLFKDVAGELDQTQIADIIDQFFPRNL